MMAERSLVGEQAPIACEIPQGKGWRRGIVDFLVAPSFEVEAATNVIVLVGWALNTHK